MDGQLDTHFINQLETKFKDSRFVRVDADVIEKLIQKEEVKESKLKDFIIGTEKELCYRLKKENPKKDFHPIKSAICPNMKKITLEKVLNSLETLEPKIKLPDKIMEKAKKPLQRMIDIGRGD